LIAASSKHCGSGNAQFAVTFWPRSVRFI